MTVLDTPQTVRKAKPPAPPKYPGLSIPDCPGKLSKSNTKLISNFHAAAKKFDDNLAELFDKHEALLNQAPDMTLRQIAKVGTELRDEKLVLTNTLITLRWKRFKILPSLIADFQASATRAKLAHEQGYMAAAKRFAREGITAESMRAGEVNPRAAEIQFKKRLESEIEVLKTVSPMRNAEAALRGIEVACAIPPTGQQCKIAWPPSSGKYGEMIHQVAGLDERQPRVELDPASEIVRDEVGLAASPLSDDLREQIAELATAVRCKPGFSRPVLGFLQTQRNPNGVLGLVEKLPRTPEVVELLEQRKASEAF